MKILPSKLPGFKTS
ncbi:hypothetical protein CJ999_23910 [Bacillus thuringiensis]|nr:hypothetical protein [Bacillus thuringiensis]PFX66558.1 hypothetical protein COL39_30355 [Bacillus cereus]